VKALTDLIRAENKEDFLNLLGRSIEINIKSSDDWHTYLKRIIETGEKYYNDLKDTQ
jgi:hypothetical protein